jgi:hypothetical protein
VVENLVRILQKALVKPQDVLDARYTELRYILRIGDVITDSFSADYQHDTNADTSTATIELELPRPPHVVPNAVVEIQAGWNNYVDTRFSGYIPKWTGSVSESDYRLMVSAVGWASRLAYADRFDLVFPGPITIRDLFNALCRRRRVPAYLADAVTNPDGTVEIALGGNPGVDDGQVVIRGGTTPLTFLNTACEPFGYRVYDTPGGIVRLSRISGTPVGEPVATFTEGHLDAGDLEVVSRGFDITTKVNYHDVRGPEYEDAYGAIIPIRSIAEDVPFDPDLWPEGFRYKRTQLSLLVTQEMADIARQVLEIDTREAHAPVSWSAIGLPGVSIGDVVAVNAASVEAAGSLWLTGMDESIDGGDFTARYTGWAGGGEPLPHGQDKIEIPLQTEPLHLGDEYVAWYSHQEPQGREASWTFTIPERATAVNIRFWHHGTNSQLVDGGAVDDLTVSRWELWRPDAGDPEKAESSGNIAPVAENYELQLPYWDGLTYWTPGAVSLRGTDAGEVTIKLVAGDNAGGDDFEVQLVVAEIYGSREPALPTEVG